MGVGSTKAGVAILAFALLLAMAAPAMAATSVTVNAEVDVNPYSIVLDDGAFLDYGTLEVGVPWTSPVLNTKVVVRNNGGVDVRLDILGTDASNGAGGVWDLDQFESATDRFRWLVAGPSGGALVDDDFSSQLQPSLSAGNSAWFDASLVMPTSTTGYGTYSWSGTIYASAP